MKFGPAPARQTIAALFDADRNAEKLGRSWHKLDDRAVLTGRLSAPLLSALPSITARRRLEAAAEVSSLAVHPRLLGLRYSAPEGLLRFFTTTTSTN